MAGPRAGPAATVRYDSTQQSPIFREVRVTKRLRAMSYEAPRKYGTLMRWAPTDGAGPSPPGLPTHASRHVLKNLKRTNVEPSRRVQRPPSAVPRTEGSRAGRGGADAPPTMTVVLARRVPPRPGHCGLTAGPAAGVGCPGQRSSEATPGPRSPLASVSSIFTAAVKCVDQMGAREQGGNMPQRGREIGACVCVCVCVRV